MPDKLERPILEAALEGLETRRSKVEEQISRLRAMMGGRRETTPAAAAVPKKRRMSAAGRKRIADAARKRWAALREQQAAASKKTATKKASKKTAKKSRPASELFGKKTVRAAKKSFLGKLVKKAGKAAGTAKTVAAVSQETPS